MTKTLTPQANESRTETGHTPGPWEVQKLNHADGDLWLQIGHNGWGPITGISGDEVKEPYCKPVAGMKYLTTSESEQWANARLIAAAPELYQAAKWLVDIWDAEHWTNESDTIKAVRNAIAKAEGRSAMNKQEGK